MELENTRTNLNVGNESAFLVSVVLPHSKIDPGDSLAELEALAQAAGALVVGKIYQNRRQPHPACYIGRGKALEIAQLVLQKNADLVIFDNDLSPAQIRELEEILNCKVLDRSEVILDIFATRARTSEARLQVDLAQLQYTYPRLARLWSHLDTVVGAAGGNGAGAVGGIGTRGTGEKQLEIDRRIVQKRIVTLRRQLQQIEQRKQRQVKARGANNFTVSLVGYTNAGKSSLMNRLTDAQTYVADKLFATLDTKTTRWQLRHNLTVLLSDTVGFVRNLPHHLIASFHATLEETLHADLLLHVVDVSNPLAEEQMNAVNTVLAELGCDDKEILLLLNKCDKPHAHTTLDTMATLYPHALPVSAVTGQGLDRLVQTITDRLLGEQLLLRVSCPYTDGQTRNFLQAHGTIIAENFDNHQMVFDAYLGRRQLPRLQQLRPTTCQVLSPVPS